MPLRRQNKQIGIIDIKINQKKKENNNNINHNEKINSNDAFVARDNGIPGSREID